jgi:hypothetical protein
MQLMTSKIIDFEAITLFYVSISFLIVSTMTFAPIMALTGLRFNQTLIFGALAALLPTIFCRVRLSRQFAASFGSVHSSRKTSTLIILFLFFSALLVLVFRTVGDVPPMTYDEDLHLMITRNAYMALGTSDLGDYFGRIMRRMILPFPYFLTIMVVPYSYFSLFTGRLFVSVISSIVPVVLYFMVREYGVDRKISILTALAFSLSSLFQNTAFFYIFDGLSTLFFTSAFFFLLKAIRIGEGGGKYAILSGMFYCLLLVTKYPPTMWILLIYVFVAVFITWKGGRSIRVPARVRARAFQLAMFCMLITAFMFLPFSNNLLELTRLVFIKWNAQTIPYAISTTWDLLFIVGWSPYLVVAIIGYRIFRSDEKDAATVASFLTVTLAFLTLVPYIPVTRRIVQAVPVLFATTTSYTYGRHSAMIVMLVLLNMSWWGVLALTQHAMLSQLFKW